MNPMTTYKLLVKNIKIPTRNSTEKKLEVRADSLGFAMARAVILMIDDGGPWQEGDKGEIWLDEPNQRAPVIEFNVPEKR
jgi:hypothetical protein